MSLSKIKPGYHQQAQFLPHHCLLMSNNNGSLDPHSTFNVFEWGFGWWKRLGGGVESVCVVGGERKSYFTDDICNPRTQSADRKRTSQSPIHISLWMILNLAELDWFSRSVGGEERQWPKQRLAPCAKLFAPELMYFEHTLLSCQDRFE